MISLSKRKGSGQAGGLQKVKFVPVFNIQEDNFIRYELPVNHLIMQLLDLSKIKKIFTFNKNATPDFFYCLYS
jgi:hypothetical protein